MRHPERIHRDWVELATEVPVSNTAIGGSDTGFN
jgi:hypothetical protein